MRHFFWGIQFLAVLGLVSLANAQETRSVIHGRVLDPTSAAVVGAAVIVTNTNTGVSSTVTTNETGYYEVPFLLPGSYQVSAESAGFSRAIRSGITLPVGARIEINMAMELGEVTESISVQAEAPLVNTSAASGSGLTFESRSITDLPTFNNSPLMLIRFAPGMQGAGNREYNGLNALGGTSTWQATGRVGGSEWAMDGAPTVGANYNTSWLPFSTSVQEFKVQTSQFDASIGHGTGAMISIMTKAGSNAFHGDLTYQTWQSVLNAADWAIRQQYLRSIATAEAAGDFTEAERIRDQRIQPSLHHHGYGGTIGGPLVRNRLFFFVTGDGFTDRKLRRGSPNLTVPTMLNRQGDFSDLRQVGARYQLYDPLSVQPDPARPGHYVRSPIVNNVIPRARMINPAYDTYVGFLPTPNNSPASATQEPLNNYVAREPLNWWQFTLSNRIDYRHSDRHSFFGRWTWSKLEEDANDWVYEQSRGLMTAGNDRNVRNATVDWTFTPSPTVIINTVVSANDFEQWTTAGSTRRATALTYKPSDVGLPAYMDQNAGDHVALPVMTWSGYVRGTEGLGRPVAVFTHYQTISAKSNVTNVRGNHTLRTGIDVRNHLRFGGDPGSASGTFDFTDAYTSREEDALTATGTLGHSWAAFAMGLPTTAAVDTNANYAISSPYVGWFVSDNWRIGSKLSLDLGFRIEYELGRQERYDRHIGHFDASADLPITALAQAAYAANPIQELAASGFVVRGGSVYPGAGGRTRRITENEWMLMPRFGLAYQFSPRTVLRGGYGLAFDRMDSLNVNPDQFGFSRRTINPITNNFGVDWLSGDPAAGISPLTDPFPVRSDGTRFDQPVGAALGLMARAGAGFNFGAFETPSRARTQRWRLDLQREITDTMMVSASYGGMYADRVNVTNRMDSLPEQFWADGLQRNNAIASNMNSNVPNPFHISNFESLQTSDPLVYQAISSTAFFTSPTIQKNRLLRAFPHMNALNQLRTPAGAVKAHSIELTFLRRLASGLMLQASYTGLYQRDRDIYFNEFDASPTWRYSNTGYPHRLAFMGIYELPFGRTKPMLQSGIGNALLGGWQLGWTYEWQPGPYLDWGNVFYNGDPNNIGLDGGQQTLDRWFDTAGFERVANLQPAAFHRRVFPTRVDGVRADGLSKWDTTIQREFRLKEGLVFQLKADIINLFNYVHFAAPNINPTSTDFGRVTSNTSTTARFVILQGRLSF